MKQPFYGLGFGVLMAPFEAVIGTTVLTYPGVYLLFIILTIFPLRVT
jgi:hypothetical protein